MGLMDSIDIQYVWKAIQESERSDEICILILLCQMGSFRRVIPPSAPPSRSVATAKNLDQNQMLRH